MLRRRISQHLHLKPHPHSRSLGLTVTTTKCVNIRKNPYRAKLELVYDYRVDYSPNGVSVNTGHNDSGRGNDQELNILGVENAIAYRIAASLDTCDPTDQSPLYAVELASRHRVFKDGESIPFYNYVCITRENDNILRCSTSTSHLFSLLVLIYF